MPKIPSFARFPLASINGHAPLKNMALEAPRLVQAEPSISSFQHGVLEPRLTWMSADASLLAWMPAIHAGMTGAADDQNAVDVGVGVEGCTLFSCSGWRV
jgi:hypothetical protein